MPCRDGASTRRMSKHYRIRFIHAAGQIMFLKHVLKYSRLLNVCRNLWIMTVKLLRWKVTKQKELLMTDFIHRCSWLSKSFSARTQFPGAATRTLTFFLGETESPALCHRACWRHVKTLGCPRVGYVCLRTHHTVSAACGRGLALLVFAAQMQQLGPAWKT